MFTGYDGAFEDAGLPPLPGEWLSIPGAPDKCGVLVAKDPAVSIAPFPWRACDSARPGCLTFLGDWPGMTDQLFDTSHFAKPYEDEKGVHLAYVRAEYKQDFEGWRYSTVQLLHGSAELVIAGPHGSFSCNAGKIHASPQGYAATLYNRNSPTYQLWGLVSRPESPSSFEIFSLHDRVGGSTVQGLVHGPGFLALEQTNGGPVFASALRLSDRTLVTTDSPPRISELPVPVPGGYFTVVPEYPHTLAFVPISGGPYRTVVRPLGGRYVTYATVDHSNQDALVWYETDVSTNDTILYTSPFATTESSLVRRAVARLPQFSRGVANAGVYLVPKSTSEARVIRLADGLAWDVPGEKNPILLSTWVNHTFLWMGISSSSVGQAGFPRYAGLVRLPRPTSPPVVPSGL